MLRLEQVARAKVIDEPYPHVVISDSLDGARELNAEFPARDRFGPTIRMDGDLTAGDPGYDDLVEASAAYGKLHRQIYSAEFIGVFLELFRSHIQTAYRRGELLANPPTLRRVTEPVETRVSGRSFVGGEELFLYPRLDIGYGIAGYGIANGGRGVHIDNLPRLISILIFLNTPRAMVGGAHRLYGLRRSRPVLKKILRPASGLLIASLQSNRAFHDAEPIVEVDGERRAFYAAISCNEPIWKKQSNARLSQLSKNRYEPAEPSGLMRKLQNLSSFFGPWLRHR